MEMRWARQWSLYSHQLAREHLELSAFRIYLALKSRLHVKVDFIIFHIILRAAVIADYKIIMDILNIFIGAWAIHHVT